MADSNLDLFPAESEPDVLRSILYHLPLSGIGTPRQESILSLLHRLAQAHHVRVADLFLKIVVPRTEIRSARFTSRFAGAYIKTANGYGKYADELIGALGSLTCIDNLRIGTFMPWLTLLDSQAGTLLYPRPRWCPSCVAEQVEAGSAVNHQLIWSCSAVSHCATHLCELQERCPQCDAEQLFLSDAVAMGRCTACRAPLARREALWSGTPGSRQRFYLDAVAAMVAANPQAEWFAQPALFSRAIFGLTQAYFDGSICKFERALGVSKRTGSKWMHATCRPRLGMLLELCYRLDVPPLRLLSAEFQPAMHGGRVRAYDSPLGAPRSALSAEKWARLRAEVDQIVREGRHVTATALAAKYGLNRHRFKYGARETYERLALHSRALRKANREARHASNQTQAREVARRLYATSSHVTRRSLAEALHAAGMHILDPYVRSAATAELQELRKRAAEGLRSNGG